MQSHRWRPQHSKSRFFFLKMARVNHTNLFRLIHLFVRCISLMRSNFRNLVTNMELISKTVVFIHVFSPWALYWIRFRKTMHHKSRYHSLGTELPQYTCVGRSGYCKEPTSVLPFRHRLWLYCPVVKLDEPYFKSCTTTYLYICIIYVWYKKKSQSNLIKTASCTTS